MLLTWLNRILYSLTLYFCLMGCFYEYYLKTRYTSSGYFLSGMMLMFFLGIFQLISIIYCYRKFTKVVGRSRKILKRHIKIVLIYILIIGCVVSYILHINNQPLDRDLNDVISPIFLMGIPLVLAGHFTYYLETLKK